MEQFSGSAPATVAAVGSMTIPLLIELGYEKDFSTAIVAVAGGLGVIIPPSIPFIMYAMATGESVSELFLAGYRTGHDDQCTANLLRILLLPPSR